MRRFEVDQVAAARRRDAQEDLAAEYRGAMSEDPEWHGLNIMGQEVPSDEVVEPPLGYVPGPDLIEQVRAMVRTELSRRAEAEGAESFEEADDFSEDDDDPYSPYEEFFDPAPGAPAGPSQAPAEAADESSRGGGGAEPPSDKPV